MTTVQPVTWQDEPAWEITDETRRTSVVVLPRRGAKIVSLRLGGHEWLGAASRPVESGSPGGRDFVAAEMHGWDECCPTIDACALVDGTTLRDHGDLWDVPWTVAPTGDGRSPGLSARVGGRDLAYEIERTVSLAADDIILDYRLTSYERVPRPFLWAAHPQFAAVPTTDQAPGTWVDLLGAGPGTTVTDPRGEEARRIPWDPASTQVRAGSCGKIWTDPDGAVHGARIMHPDGRTLTISWSGSPVTCVGVWVDGAVFADSPVLAVEPATGWYDDTAHASNVGQVLTLLPGQSVTWQLRLAPGRSV